MHQIVFITLFLGLTLGIQPVRLEVPNGIARVNLVLDRETVTTLRRAPWVARVDFSEKLVPHRLEAIGFDGDGNEVTRSEQKINASGAGSPLRLLVEKAGSGGGNVIRVLWASLASKRPDAIEVSLDGERLEVAPDLTAPLPQLEGYSIHLVTARAKEGNAWIDAQIAVGGELQSEAATELAAIPIRIVGRSPSVNDLVVRAGQNAVRAIALDDAPAEVLIVRHPSANESAIRFGASSPHSRASHFQSSAAAGFPWEIGKNLDSLSEGDEVRFIWPVAQRGGGSMNALLFGSSQRFDTAALGIGELLSRVSYPGQYSEIRIAEAVAVAGIQAVGSLKPRAIVLVIGSDEEDASRLTPAQVREYLARAGVPLHVWSLVSPRRLSARSHEWGTIRPITTNEERESAVAELRRDLDGQRMLWVEGDWFPHELTVESKGKLSVENLAH